MPVHESELARIRHLLEDQLRAIADLQSEARRLHESSHIIEKAWRVVGFTGDYVEFGAYLGDSLIQAYLASCKVLAEVLSGCWDHSMDRPAEGHQYFERAWDEMRFITFDSFKGLPGPSGVDAVYPMFRAGTYACSEEEFRSNVRHCGVPDSKAIAIAGLFKETLTDQTAQSLALKQIAIIHIDSDLYESAKEALRFCTPFIVDGTIVIFDEWYQFRGNPNLGEQRAFAEWCGAHPEWVATPFQKEGAYRNSFILSTQANKVSVSGGGAATAITNGSTVDPETSRPAFFTGEVLLANSFYNLQLQNGKPFGYYGYLSGGWIYHFDLGHVYIAPGNGTEVYIWDMASGHWWYTNTSQFPYLYDFTLNAWIYYFPDTHNAGHYTTNPRYFSNLSSNQVFTM